MIHFGKKNNSRQHNQDCEDFIDWFIEEGKKWGADTALFLGDWHDSRRTINVSTLNYSIRSLEKLANTWPTYFITGNHDLFYREKRDIHSIVIGKNLTNLKIIDEPFIQDDVAIIPWLIGAEYEEITKIKCKYMFGHFELGGFLMNQMVEMPDTKLKAVNFKHPEYVFSGHFHKRQNKGNIYYIGNCFPHNFSDAWDDERGMMLLEWGKKPEFKTWPKQPIYRTFKLSSLLEGPEKYVTDNTYAKITVDVDIDFEQSQDLKEMLLTEYNARDISFIPPRQTEEQKYDEEVEFLSVDQIVVDGLKQIDSTTINNDLLIKIYNELQVS